MKLMQARLDDMNKLGLQAEHYSLMTSAQRVGCFLLSLYRGQLAGSITLSLLYEKNMVAARLGMMPETFSRSLKQLNELGIQTDKHNVTINNIGKLLIFVCGSCSATCSECDMASDTI